MRTLFVFLFIALISLKLIAQESLSEATNGKLNQQLKINSERYGIAGQAVLILKNNQVIYKGFQGFANVELNVPLTNEHIFPSYSVTKLFTSVLVMQLVERGEIKLDESIRTYLPYLPKRWQNVTVEHTLNHTSGIPRYFDIAMKNGYFLPTKKETILSLADEPDHFVIGTQNRYNNTNYLILAEILEKISKRTYSQLVDQIIIKPLQLKNTGHASALKVIPNMVTSYQGNNGKRTKNKDVDWPELTYAHSALYSTPSDLASFMSALVKGKFVSKDSLRKFWQPMLLKSGNKGRYAFGFEYAFKDGFHQVGHDGGNRVKLRHYFSDDNTSDSYTIAYLTNGNSNNVWTDVLTESVMAIIAPSQFKNALLNERFITAALNKSPTELESVYAKAEKLFTGDQKELEQFLMYRSYSIRYGVNTKASIPAFKYYVKKFPKSENAWSSLADSWALAGNNVKAIESYKRVISLNPNAKNAARQIKLLSESL